MHNKDASSRTAGCTAFGQPGVVSDILTRALRAIMRQAGMPNLVSIDKNHLAWQKL